MTVQFVRQSMIEPRKPPVGEKGVIKWLRENLFSGWVNTALTVLGVAAVAVLLNGMLPWLLHSVWNAGSLSECRQIIAGEWGEGATGACWAVIRVRWNQFIYGFYPPQLYWRPTATFLFMFVAIVPALFYGNRRTAQIITGTVAILMAVILYWLDTPVAPLLSMVVVSALLFVIASVSERQLVWFSLLYPALTFWLLWGGSLWRPVMALAGFAIIYLVFRLLGRRLGATAALVAGAVAGCLWWLFLDAEAAEALRSVWPVAIEGVQSDRFGGFLLAFVIGVTAIVTALPLGIVLALGRLSDMPLVKGLSIGFIEFVRGVPLITMLFTASLLLQYFLPPRTQFDLILRVIVLVTLFSAAYIAEVIRGGLAALPRGQYEAADSLGLNYWQAQRLIIMPQALKVSIPGIVSSFISLFKDTTLVAFVGLADPLKGITQVVRADIAWKGIYWEPYIFVGFIFFIFCFGMSRYSMYLERRLKRDHR